MKENISMRARRKKKKIRDKWDKPIKKGKWDKPIKKSKWD